MNDTPYSFAYMECDIPEGMTIADYRRAKRAREVAQAKDRIHVRLTAIIGGWSVLQLIVLHRRAKK